MSLDGFKSYRGYKGHFDRLQTKQLTITDTIESSMIIDITDENALVVRKNNDGDDVFQVDTLNSQININGDLDITGTISYTDQSAFTTTDNILIAATNNLTDSVDTGLLFNYDTTKYTGLYRDETTKDWHLIKELTGLPTTHIGAHTLDNLSINKLTCSEIDINTLNLTSTGAQKIRMTFDADHGYIEYATNNFGGRSGYLGYGTSLSNNFTIHNERTSGDIRLTTNGNILLNGTNVTNEISTNASDISTNQTNISTNQTNISTNASNISTNASNISTNQTNISTNQTNISTNATDISNIVEWTHTATEDFNMGGHEILNCSNINADTPIYINYKSDGVTPAVRFVDSGGYMYIQAGNSTSGSHHMRLSGIGGSLLDALVIDSDQMQLKYSNNIYTLNTVATANNHMQIISKSNDSNHNKCSLSLETAGGVLKLENAYDNDPPGHATYNYCRLTNTTSKTLEMPEIKMGGDIDMDENDITNLTALHMVNSSIVSNPSLNTLEFNNNGSLAFFIDGALTMNTNIDMFNRSIINCSDPVNNQDVATKKYVDDHRTPTQICKFYGVGVSNSWHTFVCNMDDASSNLNHIFFSPYNVLIKKMVFQFDGDINSSQVFECELSDSSSFTTVTTISGVPASQTSPVFVTLNSVDPSLEYEADEQDSIYLRGRFGAVDDAEITITCWGYVWE